MSNCSECKSTKRTKTTTTFGDGESDGKKKIRNIFSHSEFCVQLLFQWKRTKRKRHNHNNNHKDKNHQESQSEPERAQERLEERRREDRDRDRERNNTTHNQNEPIKNVLASRFFRSSSSGRFCFSQSIVKVCDYPPMKKQTVCVCVRFKPSGASYVRMALRISLVVVIAIVIDCSCVFVIR